MRRMNQRSAISKIDKSGVLLVFPVNNNKEPKSLWTEFFPRRRMRWEWDDGHDSGVGDLWMLMKRLSDGRKVVYSKWYRGRATFFSRSLFTAMLKLGPISRSLSMESRSADHILDVLMSDSPLSTRDLKKLTDLQGRLNEPAFTRAMRELFVKLLIVGFGEVDDGAFPSLAVGATQLIYEDLWSEAHVMSETAARRILDLHMPPGSSFRKFFDKNS